MTLNCQGLAPDMPVTLTVPVARSSKLASAVSFGWDEPWMASCCALASIRSRRLTVRRHLENEAAGARSARAYDEHAAFGHLEALILRARLRRVRMRDPSASMMGARAV